MTQRTNFWGAQDVESCKLVLAGCTFCSLIQTLHFTAVGWIV